MTTKSGQMLSHYRLLEKIGEGGMGVVWSAEDTVLTRTVALKFLPEEFFHVPDRVSRFQREARFLASLNHSNIAAIHGLEEADGERFLVLEYVPGHSLAERLSKGPLPVDETLKICCEVARALEAAHEKGVMHRDLKPGNVQLTADGHVKVLDFGVAKALQQPSSEIDESQQATLTMATDRHKVLGTTPYMSPEQASAKPLDKRTDIWSFGCILYELLAGRRAFPGNTNSSVIAAIHGQDPDWQSLPANTPVKVRDLLRRCLAKDTDQRLHDIADARIEIEEALASPDSSPPVAETRSSFVHGVVWTLVAVTAIAALALAVWMVTRPEAAQSRTERFELTPPPGTALRDFPWGAAVAISPDGRFVAFAAESPNSSSAWQLYVRLVGELDARPLPGTEGARDAFFSPDSLWLGFWKENRLMKVPITGGEPLPICGAVLTRGASWSEDGTILFAEKGVGLSRVAAEGGEPELVAHRYQESGVSLFWPHHLPGGREALVSVRTSMRESRRKIAVLSLDNGAVTDLLTGGTYPRFAESGYLVYSRLGTLYAALFDSTTLELTGDPVPVLSDVSYDYGSGVVGFAIASSGSLVYGLGAPSLKRGELVRIDRQGNTQSLDASRATFVERLSFSPDGSRLAVAIQADAERFDVWIYEIQRGNWTRLTFDEFAVNPVWSPDGEWIVYYAERDGTYDLFRIRSDGAGEPEPLTSGLDWDFPVSFSPDGKVIAFERDSVTGSLFDIVMLPLDGDRTPQPFLATSEDERWPVFGPDGRWVAYMSKETGENEIYVRPYREHGPKVRVSTDGGTNPVWSPDGREIFYRAGQSVWVAPVDTEEGFRAGKPEHLFEAWPDNDWFGNPFQISPDGKWFVTARFPDSIEDPPRMVYVSNWIDELKRKMAEAQ